ncbi:MAG: hypothetical protein LEGION0398_MBIBDBAK_01127 [Legionellaceae bacterium]
MSNPQTIYQTNDLLLSATKKPSKREKQCLLMLALVFSLSGLWLGAKSDKKNISIVTNEAIQQSALVNQKSDFIPVNRIISQSVEAIFTPTLPNTMQLMTTSSIENLLTNRPIPIKTQRVLPQQPQWYSIILKNGDTLNKVFAQKGISAQQLQAITSLKEISPSLKKLHPGNEIKLLINADKKLQEMTFALNAIDSIEIDQKNNKFTAKIVHQPLETQLTYAGATIIHSLSKATYHAGIQGKLSLQLATIFKEKVELSKLKQGDKFKVLFEENYSKGKKVSTGNIVAAEIRTQGKIFKAVRYLDNKGNTEYYTPEGFSLKRGFIRYPLNFTHISSGYSLHRLDPVSHRWAPHQAIDFAAPIGTPIKASGDGRIQFAGRKGGYGNAIIIQHDRKYASLYAHMQHFGKGIRCGTQVKQGQVIGYVGITGMTTGPHLHYEFHVNGVKANPLKVELPLAPPLNRLARGKFIRDANQLIARLEGNEKVHLVVNTHAEKTQG